MCHVWSRSGTGSFHQVISQWLRTRSGVDSTLKTVSKPFPTKTAQIFEKKAMLILDLIIYGTFTPATFLQSLSLAGRTSKA
jgi:hypothetical protein